MYLRLIVFVTLNTQLCFGGTLCQQAVMMLAGLMLHLLLCKNCQRMSRLATLHGLQMPVTSEALHAIILYEDTQPCFTPMNLPQFQAILLLLILGWVCRHLKVFNTAERSLLLSHQNVTCGVTHALFLMGSVATNAP